MICPKCGTFCEEWHLFCPHCGSALRHEPDAEEKSDPIPEALPAPDVGPTAFPAVEAVAYQDYFPEDPVEDPAPSKPKGSLLPPLVIMAVMLCIGLVIYFFAGNTPAPAATPWFHVENGVLYFDPSQYSGSSELTVPTAVNGSYVMAISDGCFYNCDDLTTVILPDSVTVIGTEAFADCDSLRGIKLPENISQIGSGAFAGCDRLEAIYVPHAVKAIGRSAFYGCASLVHIFYAGEYEEWDALYNESIAPMTNVYCADGTHRHGNGA